MPSAGHEFKGVGARPNVFAGKPYSVYMPCGVDYAITARGRLEVALLSAPSDLAIAPYVIGPEQVTSGVWGAANFSRNYQQILTVAGQPDLPARRLVVGETYVPSGNWATYPPHKHEVDDLPREAFQEEMYFFKVNPPDGFGMVRYYNSEIDAGYIIKDNTILMAPDGYHTNNSAPGYHLLLPLVHGRRSTRAGGVRRSRFELGGPHGADAEGVGALSDETTRACWRIIAVHFDHSAATIIVSEAKPDALHRLPAGGRTGRQ